MAEYIERDMLLKMISHKPSSPTTEREDRLINGFISAVKNCPAADVRPVVRGKWIFYDSFAWECTHCGWLNYHNMGVPNVYNYCPNCGADMREPPKEE